jgi:hypothetical protein
MLEVALLRRICCSRACSVSVKPRLAIEVDRTTDDAARHLAHVFGACRHEAEIRSAGRERHAKRLAIATGNVGAFAPTRPAA